MSGSRPSRRQMWPGNVHPVWRGIGCIFMVLIPILAFGLADLLLDYLASTEYAPDTPSRVLPLIGEIPNFWVWLALGVLLIPFLLWLLSIVGALLYSALGGPENERMVDRQREKDHGFDQRGRR